MNWDAIAAIAELLGSLAVVGTLLFLIVQIRANSVMIQNATAQDSASAVADWSRQLTGNPELHRIYRKGLRDYSALDYEERGLFDLLMFQVFNSIASIYLQYQNGGLGEDRWDAEMQVFDSHYTKPGGKESWERQKHLVNANFRKLVESRYIEPEGLQQEADKHLQL